MAEENITGYGKRPLWQWLLIYAIIGLVAYGLIYYFVLAKKGGSIYNPSPTPPATTAEATPSPVAVSKDTVTLTKDGFSPATLTITADEKVTWTNQSGSDATVSSDPHPTHTNYQPLNLGKFSDGGTLTLTFDKTGTYGYHNHLNPTQTGTIIVK